MEINALAAATVAALAPYLAKICGEFAKEAGQAAGTALTGLYETVRAYFKKKPAAEEALKDLEADPKDEDNQAALRKEIRKMVKDDPAFGKALEEQLKDLRKDAQSVTFLTQVYGGEVGKIINIGEANEVRID